jgi:hypothetical protein
MGRGSDNHDGFHARPPGTRVEALGQGKEGEGGRGKGKREDGGGNLRVLALALAFYPDLRR